MVWKGSVATGRKLRKGTEQQERHVYINLTALAPPPLISRQPLLLTVDESARSLVDIVVALRQPARSV
jgi:hypothetical protein